MCCRAKSIDAYRFAGTRRHEGAPPDQSCAEEGSQSNRIAIVRQPEGVGRIRNRMRRKPSVAGVAGEQRLVAEVLVPTDAVGAMSAGMAKPGNADALSQLVIVDA